MSGIEKQGKESIERRVKLESISITYNGKLYKSLYMIPLPRLSIVMKIIRRKGQCMQQTVVSVTNPINRIYIGESSRTLLHRRRTLGRHSLNLNSMVRIVVVLRNVPRGFTTRNYMTTENQTM